MNEIDADMVKAVSEAMDLAGVAWYNGDGETAATDLINELAVHGYKIVKDSEA